MSDKKINLEIEQAIENYAAEIRMRRLSDLDLADRYGRAKTFYYNSLASGKEVFDTYIVKKGYEKVCVERGIKIN